MSAEKPPHAPAPRLSDVARAAGVDVSTASRVLNSDTRHRVASDTRARVLAAARALDYRPNPIARALRTARSHTLGIVVPQLDNPVFAQVIIGAETAARARGYSLLIAHVGPGVASGAEVYTRLAQAHHVDGLLAASLESDAALGAALARAGVPAVVLNRQLRAVPHHVVFDNEAAARIATEHLLALGHRHVAHLAGRTRGYNGRHRIAGFRAALRSAGARPAAALVAAAGYTLDGGARAMRSLLSAPVRPTAVVAPPQQSAAGALKALHEAGLSVPDDVSVVAIHDAEIADMLYPPLTTVRLPLRAMGARAADGLIDMVEGRSVAVAHVLAPEGLVLRSSTSAP